MMVELVVFEIAGVRYAVELSQVLRVDRPLGARSVGTPLGVPLAARRALVFATPSGEARLEVDEVLGVRTVGPEALRRLPAMVRAPSLARGALIDDEAAVLVIDLPALNDSLRGLDAQPRQ